MPSQLEKLYRRNEYVDTKNKQSKQPDKFPKHLDILWKQLAKQS